MTRWEQIEALYSAARELEGAQRAAFLAEACRADDELRHRIEQMLDIDSGGQVLDRPAVELVDAGIEPGTSLGPYRIERLLGRGGMGRVYAALDTRLNRHVAIKITSEEFAGRFKREAKAIAALNHPNICTLYDVGPNYLVMELVEGQALDKISQQGQLPIKTAVSYGVQIAEALSAAHAGGLTHRDLKPANIMISPGGVKVLDFGLALRDYRAAPNENSSTVTIDVETAEGTILGTARYMSPEQAEGKRADARSDIFSFGIVLYEILCGRPPFQGDTMVGVLASILQASPEPPRQIRPEIPVALERIILKCLEKDPADRFSSARGLIEALQATNRAPAAGSFAVPRWGAIAAALLVLVGAATLAWKFYQERQREQFVAGAPQQIRSLLNEDRLYAAYQLYRQGLEYAPDSAELSAQSEWLGTSKLTITSSPPGAAIAIGDYLYASKNPDAAMVDLGVTPLEVDVPWTGFYLIRASVGGRETLTLNANLTSPNIEIRFNDPQKDPAGMRWVQATGTGAVSSAPAEIPGFWLDTHEVTNREYQQFVKAGGYSSPEYWTQRFVKDGRDLSFQEAMAEFTDATRRPGPATWRGGVPPEGSEDLPVGGVSWYEAMAYARYAGKTLPGYFHWMWASGVDFGSSMGLVSNFAGNGPLPALGDRAVDRFGHSDMGGNVKEWASSVIDGQHALLGGSWEEPTYVITQVDRRSPFARENTFGFRCALYEQPPDDRLLAPFKLITKDRTKDDPIGDEGYGLLKRLYSYQETPLEPSDPDTVDFSAYWTEETISFAAPYDGERIIAHVFLPKNARPPYQTIVAALGLDALYVQSLDKVSYVPMFLVRSGRALVIPAYKGSLERSAPLGTMAKWPIDFSRTLDYLGTRPETFDTSRIAFWGLSWGAAFGPNLLALDPRPRAGVFLAGSTIAPPPRAEADPLNFMPRTTVPVLMINAREDFISPREAAQDMYRRLGAKEPDKEIKFVSGGHMDVVSRAEPMEWTLDWFDRYLGPVALTR